MKSIEQFQNLYLYREPVDMRKYRNGLCEIIVHKMKRDVFTSSLFIFTNKKKDILRIIYWDKTGFAVWSKKLDEQKYRWPKKMFSGQELKITDKQLQLLFNGIDITAHKELAYKTMF